MNQDLRTCPNSPTHKVYGGYPEYVCSDCATQWKIAKAKGGRHIVLYTQFNSEGTVVSRWKKALNDDNTLVSVCRRTMAV